MAACAVLTAAGMSWVEATESRMPTPPTPNAAPMAMHLNAKVLTFGETPYDATNGVHWFRLCWTGIRFKSMDTDPLLRDHAHVAGLCRGQVPRPIDRAWPGSSSISWVSLLMLVSGSVPPQTSSAPSGYAASARRNKVPTRKITVMATCTSGALLCSGPFDDPSDDIAPCFVSHGLETTRSSGREGLMLGVRSVRGWSRVRSNATVQLPYAVIPSL